VALPVEVIFTIDLIATFAVYLIISLSLNLEFGYAGIPNFGKVLAVAGGAFTVGFFPGRIVAWLLGIGPGLDYIAHNAEIVTQVNQVLKNDPTFALALFSATLIIAGIIGAALGFIACYPAIRLREDYLGITLLAMGEAIRVIGYNYPPIIGGTLGVMVPDPFAWAEELRYTVISLAMLGISILALFYLERFVRTPLGRMLRAIRDNENVAESLGKDVTRVRMKTIIMSSVIGSIGGALYAFYTSGVISLAYHRATWTFWPWVMVILGGAANNVGAVLGTFTFVTVRKLITFYKEQLTPLIPFSVVWLDFLLLGVALILIQMYRPEGIVPEKPTFTLDFKKLKKTVESSKKGSSKN